jgi:hypothetical protein
MIAQESRSEPQTFEPRAMVRTWIRQSAEIAGQPRIPIVAVIRFDGAFQHTRAQFRDFQIHFMERSFRGCGRRYQSAGSAELP